MELTDNAAADRLFTKIAWRLVPWLFAGYVIAYIDRVNVGFAKLQMVEDLKCGATVYGFGAGIFFLGFVIMEIPSNLILYRVGARVWLARIMVTWGVLSVLLLFVRTPLSFYVLRFLLGAAEAGFLPGVIYFLTLWFPADRRGRIFAIFFAAAATGGAIVGPASGWIMAHLNDFMGLRGWQWLFVVQGTPAILLGGLLFMLLDDGPNEAKWLSAQDRSRLARHVAAPAPTGDRETSLGSALLSPSTWLLGLILGLVNLGIYVGVFWLPTIIRAGGVTGYESIGWISSLAYVISAAAMLALGRSSDHFGERRRHIGGTFFIAALSLAASALSAAPLWSIGGLILATALLIAATPLLWAHAASFMSGKAAAIGFALLNACAGVAAFLAPYLMGVAQAQMGSTQLVLLCTAGGAALGGMLIVAAPSLIAPGSPAPECARQT
jgi:MFS family permease